MSSYAVTDYLLDRANIQDTVMKLPWFYDTASEEGLANEVFAPEVQIDYTRIMGGEVFEIAGPEWAGKVQAILRGFDATQHIYGNLIVNLPQPNQGSRPDTATVFSEAGASMVNAKARGGALMQNGGRAVLEVTRLPELEEKGQNPWRISSMEVIPAWEKGNWAVMDAGFQGSK